MPRRIVIIGGNASGTDAASAARKTDRNAEITLIEKEEHSSYARCGLPFVLAGEVPRFEDLLEFQPSFFKMMKIDRRMETTATAIDPKKKTVKVMDKAGVEEVLPYDSLILATGAVPTIPRKYIKGCDKEGVYVLRTIHDGKKIKEAMESAESALVVGAGLIGLEVAHALSENKINTTVAEVLPYALPLMLDKDMGDLVKERIEEHGVNVMVGQPVEEILGGECVKDAIVGGKRIEADIVIMATGVRPESELAKQIGAETGLRGAIKVDHRMATSVPDVYAIGDCVQTYNMLTGQSAISQLGTTAVRQAKVAGVNAAGGYSTFQGVLGSAVTRIFGFEVGAVGLTEFSAKRAGFKTVVGRITSKTKADYFPGGEEIRIKIVAEPEFGKVIGAQIIAGEEVTQRINMISVAIQKGMTVFELAKADTCYAPPVNEPWEPVVLAAEMAARRIRR